MKHATHASNHTPKAVNDRAFPKATGGLPVRTNLRAGLAWDDLDDKAKELFGKLTSAVSSATSALTGGSDTSKPAA